MYSQCIFLFIQFYRIYGIRMSMVMVPGINGRKILAKNSNIHCIGGEYRIENRNADVRTAGS